MPLLTTTGVGPSLHTWREYDCLTCYNCRKIFPATSSHTSHRGFSQIHTAATFYKIQVKVKSKPSIMARRLHDHWMIGISTSVLNYEFTTFLQTWGWCGGGAFQWKIDASNQAPGSQTSLVLKRWGWKEKPKFSKCEVTAKVLLESCWIWEEKYVKQEISGGQKEIWRGSQQTAGHCSPWPGEKSSSGLNQR